MGPSVSPERQTVTVDHEFTGGELGKALHRVRRSIWAWRLPFDGLERLDKVVSADDHFKIVESEHEGRFIGRRDEGDVADVVTRNGASQRKDDRDESILQKASCRITDTSLTGEVRSKGFFEGTTLAARSRESPSRS